MAGKGDDPLAPRPRFVTDVWIIQDIVGQARRPFCGDQADLELSHRDAAIGAIALVVRTRARGEFQHLLVLVECPYEGEGHIEMSGDRFGARLQNRPEVVSLGKGEVDVSTDQRLADLRGPDRFRVLSFANIADTAGEAALSLPDDFAERDLDRKVLTILSASHEFRSAPVDAALAGLHIAPNTRPMPRRLGL